MSEQESTCDGAGALFGLRADQKRAPKLTCSGGAFPEHVGTCSGGAYLEHAGERRSDVVVTCGAVT
eukprot:6641185-Pyramimonas_sp.AAC.1